MLRIGTHCIDTRVVLAPMVGVTDHPYRQLCARLGTRLAIAEMVGADTRLWNTRKSRLRRAGVISNGPRWVQIVGNDPTQMALAARQQAELGADIIDINMGCPAKNVCRKAAGSALLRDEALVADILRTVVAAVPELPVTLKMRTGWCPSTRNGVAIARIAEDCGIRLLSVHGRTRACRFQGEAEYRTIADIVASVSIPVIANGDIDSARRAAEVIELTGAAAVMIGRAAQGKPWLCAAIDAMLRHGQAVAAPRQAVLQHMMIEHLEGLHSFYGEQQGLRVARKHVGWYLDGQPAAREFLRGFHVLDEAQRQLQALSEYFKQTDEQGAMAA